MARPTRHDSYYDTYYVMYERSWVPKPCPCCHQHIARNHGWLFTDAPPVAPAFDTRTPVGETFLHDEGEDCVRLVESEMPQSLQ